MKLKHFIPAAILWAGLCGGLYADDVQPPNVVFFFTDDQRPDTVGALGNDRIRTPNIDRLYRRGTAFTRAYCMGSKRGAVCTPSRGMVLSGRSLIDAGQFTKHVPAVEGDPEQRTWPSAMKAAGYATLRTGKKGNHPSSITGLFDEDIDIVRAVDAAQRHADNAIRFVREHAGKRPFFLYMAFGTPHDPQPAPDTYHAMYRPSDMPLSPNFLPVHPFDNGELTVRDEKTLPFPRTRAEVQGKLAKYYASITYTDDQVGRVMKALEEAGVLDRTLVIFASDNGLSLGDHGLLGKQNLYEFGGMHVPLAIAGPGVDTRTSDALVYLFDLYPTVCEMAGLHVPRQIDGRSFAPVLRGEREEFRETLFCMYRNAQRSVRDARWKLIRYPLVDRTQLFDLENDRHELKNLADDPAHAETLERMMALLRSGQKTFGDEAPLEVEAAAKADITVDELLSRIAKKEKKRNENPKQRKP